jgi:hypothetical protein
MRYNRTAIILSLVASLSHAQDAPSERETIQQLAQQVKALESQQRASSPAPADPTPQPASIPAPQAADSNAQPPSLPQGLHELHGIQWRGFGEVNYKVLNQRKPELGTYGFDPGSHGNFYTGDFDLFLTSRISDKASVLSEIAFGEGDGQTFNVDLDRFLLKYDFDDHLKMSFGRYQTGVGFYNSEFRSAKWLLTTADRPLIMEFTDAGGLLPTQAVGVSVTGLIPSGKLGLNYLFEYGSSDATRPDIDGSGNVDDEHNSNHVLAGFFVRPDWLPGLQVGSSFYHDAISRTDETPVLRFDQTIVSAHVVYLHKGIEILNEGVLIRHHLEGTQILFNQPAFYSQFSKQLHHIRPFFRYQYANMNETGFFNDVGLRCGPSFGARYDFNDNIAFKVQLDHTVRDDKPDLNGLQMQMAFTF